MSIFPLAAPNAKSKLVIEPRRDKVDVREGCVDAYRVLPSNIGGDCFKRVCMPYLLKVNKRITAFGNLFETYQAIACRWQTPGLTTNSPTQLLVHSLPEVLCTDHHLKKVMTIINVFGNIMIED